MAITRASAGVDAHAVALTTLSVTTVTIGNLLVVTVKLPATFSLASVSCDKTSTFWRAAVATGTNRNIEIWCATVTSTGAGTVTLTYNSTPGAGNTEICADEYAAGGGSETVWYTQPAGGQDNASSLTVTLPPLTAPAPSLSYAYHGGGWMANSYNASLTAGYTGRATGTFNEVIWNLSVTGAQSPTFAQTPAGDSTTAGVIIAATTTHAKVARGTTQSMRTATR